MNAITALLGVFAFAIMAAIGYVFYLFAGPLAGIIFVAVGLGSAFAAQYLMGDGVSGGDARIETRSKGAQNQEE